MTEQPTTEIPAHCADCAKPLMLRRPGRTRCEACYPTIRSVADILAGRPSTIHGETAR